MEQLINDPTTRLADLKTLVRQGHIAMDWAPSILERPAPFAGHSIKRDRLRGMLLGLAIGDSLGNTTESVRPHDRRARYGEIRDYLKNRYARNRAVGVPSDDTQMAFWMLEHLIDHGWIRPDELGRLYADRQIYGIGHGTRDFVQAVRDGAIWPRSAQESAGNGSLTRMPMVVVPHAAAGSSDFWTDVVLATATTHNDRAAISAGVAIAGMLGELLVSRSVPSSDWWLDRFIAYARPVEGANRLKPRGGPLLGQYEGPLWQFAEEQLRQHRHRSIVEACAIWYSGAYILETIPSVLLILSRHADDPEEAIVRAVNDTKDNDTIAALVGSALGALHGESALPRRWRDGLLGRTGAADDGHVFELMDHAFARFGVDSVMFAQEVRLPGTATLAGATDVVLNKLELEGGYLNRIETK